MSTLSVDGRRVRTDEEVKGVARGPAGSLLRTAAEGVAVHGPYVPPKKLGGPEHRRLRDRVKFRTAALLVWAWQYVRHIVAGRSPLASYPPGPPGQNGVYRIPNDVSVGLAADWGTGTASAYRVSDRMRDMSPHVTIHLGDVYYSGTPEEYKTYFLAPKAWPPGTLQSTSSSQARGTYVLNANHEMYCGGAGYFNVALPELHQEASYFCLENEYWRIIGLDTGYHSTRGIWKLLPFNDRTKLHAAELEWLDGVVLGKPSDRRPIILLTHHQWFSGFSDRDYPKIGEQLQPYLDRVALWFWGHEHRFAGYAEFSPAGVKVRARCIGHGGMPIELDDQPSRYTWPTFRPPVQHRFHAAVVFSDQRYARTLKHDTKVGLCGFALLQFQGQELVVTYKDELDHTLLQETWRQSGETLVGSVQLFETAPSFVRSRDIEDLVR